MSPPFQPQNWKWVTIMILRHSWAWGALQKHSRGPQQSWEASTAKSKLKNLPSLVAVQFWWSRHCFHSSLPLRGHREGFRKLVTCEPEVKSLWGLSTPLMNDILVFIHISLTSLPLPCRTTKHCLKHTWVAGLTSKLEKPVCATQPRSSITVQSYNCRVLGDVVKAP